jgi:hypothetical protein
MLGGLLHDPLGGDQVDDGVGCLIEVLLGPVMVSQPPFESPTR